MFDNVFPKILPFVKSRTEQDKPHDITRRVRFECWISKATAKHTEYLVLIAFPRQLYLREHGSVFRYTYIACLV
jgi:hypothetical protein